MQTALHIHALVRQLDREITGAVVTETAFYRKERAAYLFLKQGKERFALGFVFHPTGSGTFLIPASKLNLETNEKPWPFFEISGWSVRQAGSYGLDRIFRIVVGKEHETRTLVFESIGPNGNLWLIDERNTILATLRHRDGTIGTAYSISQSTKLDPIQVAEEPFTERFKDQADSFLSLFLEKQLTGWNKTLANETLVRAAIENAAVGSLTTEQVSHLLKTVKEVAARFDDWETGYLYSFPWGGEVYPLKLSSREEKPEKFKNLSFAVYEMVNRKQVAVEQEDESKVVLDTIARAIKRVEGRLVKMESDRVHAADFERYKLLGDLLQINFEKLRRGLDAIAVDDVITHTGNITIELDSALAPRENIDAYFKKHRKGREGLELIERRIELSHAELAKLREIQSELEKNCDAASQRYAEELASLLPKERKKSDAPAPRLPYREVELSTGLTIFVGKDGTDNDRTTFEFAKPYELWFHAAQCPGSHVVMKFPNKAFVPSKREIEETAAIAAWHSKARNDSLVPVSYTEKRYVRKPRKAKPGLVTIEREKSVMVVPKKPE